MVVFLLVRFGGILFEFLKKKKKDWAVSERIQKIVVDNNHENKP